MTTWAELSAMLFELASREPMPLREYPDPHPNPRQASPPAPYRITLAAWAVEVAQTLHDRFGDDLALTVGFLEYPSGSVADAWLVEAMTRPAAEPLLDPAEVEVVAGEELEARSGWDRQAKVLVVNQGDTPIQISTNGHLTGRVLDRATGEVVGGYVGAQRLPLIPFRAEPGASVSVPLLLGTASLRPELGYAVPPGAWAVDAPLNLTDKGRYRMPRLPLRIVP